MGVFQAGKDDANRPLDLTLLPYAQSLAAAAKREARPYDWVVVMAGINDLGAGNYTATAVMPRLKQVRARRTASAASAARAAHAVRAPLQFEVRVG